MGNDIISSWIERKKTFIMQTTLLFIKYLVDEKVKLNKTVEYMTRIYFRDFYLIDYHSYEELDTYFSLATSKDDLLKKSLLSAIRFYKENGIEEKIEEDIRTIVLLANSFYLALSLNEIMDACYDKNSTDFISPFFKKYQNKMRICKEGKLPKLEEEVTTLFKKELAIYRKFFKCLEDSQFHLTLELILDYTSGYMVYGKQDIRMLLRYAKNEVEQVYQEKFYFQHLLIILEKIEIVIIKNMMANDNFHCYFVEVPLAFIEKENCYETIKKIGSHLQFRQRVVFVFSYKEIMRHSKVLEMLRKDGFKVAIKDLEELELSEKIVSTVQYLFIRPELLDGNPSYLSSCEDKDIHFILWEGEVS